MTWLTPFVTLILVFTALDLGVASDVKQPLNAWSDEIVPAAIDPEIARLVEMMNAPEPWDHNWYAIDKTFATRKKPSV